MTTNSKQRRPAAANEAATGQIPEFEPGPVMLSLGELMDMWVPEWGMGRHWIKRAVDGSLYWALPDVDGGILVPAFKPADMPAHRARSRAFLTGNLQGPSRPEKAA